MKSNSLRSSVLSSLCLLALSVAACGQIDTLLTKQGDNKSEQQSSTYDSENSQLLDGTFSAAAGSSDPSLRPYPMDGLAGRGEFEGDDRGDDHGRGRGGHHGGGHGPHGSGKGRGDKGPPALPADIEALMKAADAKKDTVLKIDRAKVDEILKAMRTDLEALRTVAVSREDFQAQAKTIQDKYTPQLRAVVPAFETLSQEQKDRVKALHDLQKKVIDGCVARGADAASATCTTAKSDLQANIDAP